MAESILSPKEISRSLEEITVRKAQMPSAALAFYGVLAGAYIGFGAIGALTVSSGWSPEAAWGLKRFVAGSVFSVGLMLVLVPGSELFTGNILMSVGLVKHRVRLDGVLRNWIFVYLGNFVGSVILAGLVYHSGLLGTEELTPVGQSAVAASTAKMEIPFVQAFLRGVLCNMLVCLAVIMSLASRDLMGKIFACYFPIMAFVAAGFEHSVANMFFIPAGLMAEEAFFDAGRWVAMWGNLIPVTLGNIVGGVAIVLLNPARYRWARPKADVQKK
jgi:formate/nitrite transporter